MEIGCILGRNFFPHFPQGTPLALFVIFLNFENLYFSLKFSHHFCS
jgi:hypothetical protein